MAGHSFKRIPYVAGRLSQEGHDDIHQLHSHQHPDIRVEPAPGKGNHLASADGHYTETHYYRAACARTGLAASRRASLVVQKIYRRGSDPVFTSSSSARAQELIAMRHSRRPTLRLVGGTATTLTTSAEGPASTPPPSAEDIALIEAARCLLTADRADWPNTDAIGPNGWHYQLRATMAPAIETIMRSDSA